MSDMSAIIVPKSDQINADDLQGGRTITVTVTKVTIRGGQEQPISIHLAETDKVYRPCKSMCRVLAQAWGLDSALYAGRSMTLYTDPSVKFGPLAVGGIRISHMSHIDGPLVMALTATKGVKKSYKVLPLDVPVKQTGNTTVEQAEAALRRAGSLDELRATWSNKAMAPFREALQPVLGEMKAKLTPAIENDDPFGLPPLTGEETVTEENPTAQEGRADSERGEELFPSEDPARITANELIAEIEAAQDIDALGQVMATNRGMIVKLGEDLGNEIWAAHARRKAALMGGRG